MGKNIVPNTCQFEWFWVYKNPHKNVKLNYFQIWSALFLLKRAKKMCNTNCTEDKLFFNAFQMLIMIPNCWRIQFLKHLESVVVNKLLIFLAIKFISYDYNLLLFF